MPDNESDEKTGMVLRIERSSIYDGEGFRTVVFLKGCPLRCLWCSTPESQSFETERAGDNVYGTRMGVEQLMKEIRKDSVFYFHSGGGLTLSGGEPLSQADFSAELLRRAHDEGINTAMETSLAASFVQVGKTLPHLDVVYADLKHVDPEKHKKFCGAPNMMILQNIRRIDEMGGPARLIVRVPVVPGINDDEESLSGMAAFCSELKNLHGVQLLPYHRLGIDTYRKLGRNYPLNSLQRPGDAHMEHCRAIFRRHVGEVQ